MGAENLLPVQIERTREACVGLSEQLKDLKQMAGINTAVTSVGTVAGGVALGTGIAKANVDEDIEYIDAILDEAGVITIETEDQLLEVLARLFDETEMPEGASIADDLRTLRDSLREESIVLGKVRTGTLAGAAVADTAGMIISMKNRVDEDLQSQIDLCIAEKEKLSQAFMQARIDGGADVAMLERANKIIQACSAWELVDLSKINNRAKGGAISAGTGAATAIAGTVTSALANSEPVRGDDSDDGKKKEANLNVASNVLAGGATVAAGVATVFNATQIAAVKRAVSAAEKCEGAF